MAKINLNKSKQKNTPGKSTPQKLKKKTPNKAKKRINFKSKNRIQKTPKRKPIPVTINSSQRKSNRRNRPRKCTEMPRVLQDFQIVSETTYINISDDEDVTVVDDSKMITVIEKDKQSDSGCLEADSTLIVIPDEPITEKDTFDEGDDSTLRNEMSTVCSTSKSFVSADYIPLEMESQETIQGLQGNVNEIVYISDSEDVPVVSKSLKRRSKSYYESLSEGEISDSITILDDTVIENVRAKSCSPSTKNSMSKKQRTANSPRSPRNKRRKRIVNTKEIGLSPMPSTSRISSENMKPNTSRGNKKMGPRNTSVSSQENRAPIDKAALEKLSEVLSKIPDLPEFLSQLSKVKTNGVASDNGETSRVDESDCINMDRTYYSHGQFISDNIYHVEKVKRKGLRPIVIDGSNVAMQHSQGKKFSVKGLKICIDYFHVRGHKVYAFVPSYRMKRNQSTDQKLLMELEQKKLVFLTSSREVLGHKICSYDDRMLVKAAAAMDAVIVSNDNYRDLMLEDRRLIPVIRNNLLSPTWVGDMIIFPDDPLGRHGPTLKDFLRY